MLYFIVLCSFIGFLIGGYIGGMKAIKELKKSIKDSADWFEEFNKHHHL